MSKSQKEDPIINTSLNSIELEEKTFTANGVYTSNLDGFSKVTIDVKPILQEKTTFENGLIKPNDGFDGLKSVNVQVPTPIYNSKELIITTNGEYLASNELLDGFSKVTANIPTKVQKQSFTKNGTYTPDSGYDGFSEVTIDVNPKFGTLIATKNKTYKASEDPQIIDGYSEVTVDFPLTSLLVMNNGVFTAEENQGFNEVIVDVHPKVTGEYITKNGVYRPSEDFEGFNEVIVNIPDPPLQVPSIITENGTYSPEENFYGFSDISVNVQPKLQELTVTESQEYFPEEGYEGFSKVKVNFTGSSSLQEKKVNIDTDTLDILEITPDLGYLGLKKVILKAFPGIFSPVDLLNFNQETTTGINANHLVISTLNPKNKKGGVNIFQVDFQSSIAKEILLDTSVNTLKLKYFTKLLCFEHNTLVASEVISKIYKESLENQLNQLVLKYSFNPQSKSILELSLELNEKRGTLEKKLTIFYPEAIESTESSNQELKALRLPDKFLNLLPNHIFWDNHHVYCLNSSLEPVKILTDVTVHDALSSNNYALLKVLSINSQIETYIISNNGKFVLKLFEDDTEFVKCTKDMFERLYLFNFMIFPPERTKKAPNTIYFLGSISKFSPNIEIFKYSIDSKVLTHLSYSLKRTSPFSSNFFMQFYFVIDSVSQQKYFKILITDSTQFWIFDISDDYLEQTFDTSELNLHINIPGTRLTSLIPIETNETNGLFYAGSENGNIYQIQMETEMALESSEPKVSE